MDKTNVIIKPLVTEKTTHQQATRNSYAFEVRTTATKPQIKHAVESLYEVKVLEVRTMVRKGKPPYTPTVLSWLSAHIGKPGRLITPDDVAKVLAT